MTEAIVIGIIVLVILFIKTSIKAYKLNEKLLSLKNKVDWQYMLLKDIQLKQREQLIQKGLLEKAEELDALFLSLVFNLKRAEHEFKSMYPRHMEEELEKLKLQSEELITQLKDIMKQLKE